MRQPISLLLIVIVLLITGCDKDNAIQSQLNGVLPSQITSDSPEIIKVNQTIEQYYPAPDGKRVALVVQRTRSFGLTLIDLDSALATPITTTSQSPGPISKLRWSPDGTAVAFSAPPLITDSERSLIYIYDVQARHEVTVNVSSAITSSIVPVWNSKGDSLYFIAERAGGSDMMQVARDGSNPTKLFTLTDKQGEVARLFSVIGDGQQFVITIQPATSDVASLYLTDGKGENRRKLTDSYRLNSLQLSPAGNAVLLEQAPDTSNISATVNVTYTLSTIVPLGSTGAPLILPPPPTVGKGMDNRLIASSGAAAWSPNGDKIAYFTTSSVNYATMLRSLMVAQADGRNPVAVYSTADDIRAPAVLYWANNDSILLIKGGDSFAVIRLKKR